MALLLLGGEAEVGAVRRVADTQDMAKVCEMARDELVTIVEEALPEDCAASTKEKLRTVAATTEAVAVGWFHCDGVKCPARQARRTHQGFQQAFDVAMAERFGRAIDLSREATFVMEPFVVAVVDA